MSFTVLPICAIEVIQTQDTQERIKQSTKIYDKSQLKEVKREGIEIKNPIDVFRAKKEKSTVTPKEPSRITLDCDTMEYKNDTNEVEAKGNVILNTYPERTKLTADRGVFDRSANIIKLFDNVRLYKAGGVLKGDYMVIDLNTENVLLNEPIGDFSTFKLTAREGHAYANRIEAINGDLELARKMETKLQSSGFGSIYDYDFLFPDDNAFELKKKRSEPFKIKTNEIIIKGGQDHDDITFKNADIYYKKFKLATASNVQIFTDKEQNYVETNMPEIGSLQDFGTYVGPGFTFKTPGSSTFKVAPIFVSGDGGIGFGAIARHKSKRNWAEAAWSSSSKNLIVRGNYKFNKKLRLDYSRHGYMNEGIFGENRPGYLLQLAYEDIWHNDDLNADYWQMITGGYVSDYFKDDQEKHSGTMRLRWQGRFNKDFINFKNDEQDMYLRLGAGVDGLATIYGTGDVFAMGRVGPYINSKFKGWGSKIYFTLGGMHGRSPYIFDEYRYGRVTITIDESIKLCNYLALGYRGTLTPLKDNYDKNFLTENKFYALVGPEDVKLAISYDTVREYAGFDVIFLLGSDNTKIKYNKLIVDDPTSVSEKRKLLDEWNLRKIEVPEAI